MPKFKEGDIILDADGTTASVIGLDYKHNTYIISVANSAHPVVYSFDAVDKDCALLYSCFSKPKEEVHTCTMKEYVGLTQRYSYCTVCDKKVLSAS